MTIQEIINLLSISGSNTKKLVLDKLVNASIKDLLELRESINEELRIRASKN